MRGKRANGTKHERNMATLRVRSNDPKAILTVTSPIVINVPTRDPFGVETKDSFVLWLEIFK